LVYTEKNGKGVIAALRRAMKQPETYLILLKGFGGKIPFRSDTLHAYLQKNV